MPLAPEYDGGRGHPFAPRVRTSTVWLLVAAWAPFTGLVMALADPPLERTTFLARIAANWGIVPIFSLRLLIAYATTRKAFAAQTRLQAIAWLGAGGAVLVLMLASTLPATGERRGPEGWDVLGEFLATPAALAAAWYAVLAAFLYRPRGRSSDEQRDVAVALVGWWLAVPATAIALMMTGISDPWYPACAPVARMTLALFGHGVWFGTGFPRIGRLDPSAPTAMSCLACSSCSPSSCLALSRSALCCVSSRVDGGCVGSRTGESPDGRSWKRPRRDRPTSRY
jgi:hypothetical protein